MKKIDITGQKFGRLTVMRRADGKLGSKSYWVCRCSCGGETTTKSAFLKRGSTQSCGCYNRDRTSETNRTHGMSRCAEFNAWINLTMRCTNPRDTSYKNYGGRGIKVCKRWLKFENFFKDMGKKPTPLHSIDRFPNNDGDYRPGNCRWATRSQQARNKRKGLKRKSKNSR